MAKTQAGKDLTEQHRRNQILLRASVEAAAPALDPLMDLEDLRGSFPRWFAGRSVLANAGVDTSARLAGAYVAEYGRAEAGVELVAGTPEFDQQRIAREAYTDTVVMTKARIAAGMSPEEAWRIQSAITYGKLGQLVLDAGRQTVTTSSFKYSGRRGRWRRVSDGAPCAFCAMLVGRGPVYQEQSVQFRAHNHCGCTAELVLHEWEPTEEEALYRASYLQAALDAEEEFGRSWARTAAGENQILARMRRNNPGLFNDGVFAKDSQFRSPAWIKAKESTRRRREKIKLATGLGGGGAKPPKLPTSGRPFWEADPDDGSLPDAYIAPPGFRMPFTRKTRPRATYERAEHALSRHASDAVITSEGQTFFPADFDDIEAIKYVMDRAVYLGEPRLDGQALHFSAEIQGVICNVAIRREDGKWVPRSVWPVSGRSVMVARNGRKTPLQ